MLVLGSGLIIIITMIISGQFTAQKQSEILAIYAEGTTVNIGMSSEAVPVARS